MTLDAHFDDESSLNHLSYVGRAAYKVLRTRHNERQRSLWNVSTGVVVGELHQTPPRLFQSDQIEDPQDGHSDWLAYKMAEIVARTEYFCDIMSMPAPDGLFLETMQSALMKLCEKADKLGRTITIRMLFGNIIGMPVNGDVFVKQLTSKLPSNPNIRLYVGAWRKGSSWNHAKIIAVDGLYLHTGGHNMWQVHHLDPNPILDLAIEMKGQVAIDAHLYANEQWTFVESIQSDFVTSMIGLVRDNIFYIPKSRVYASVYPPGPKRRKFPPLFNKESVESECFTCDDSVPVISIGRNGSIALRHCAPSDDAFNAMFDVAKKNIRIVMQDIGPHCIHFSHIPVPGGFWPKEYLAALGRAICDRNVKVQIVLSNLKSVPGGLRGWEACWNKYGHGWTCTEVAAEIVKATEKEFPEFQNKRWHLIDKIEQNLQLCYVRKFGGSNKWDNGKDTIGLHSKHFIVDDICAYVGSQNLYVSDLAEWGIVIDDKKSVAKIMEEYWNPLWQASYTGTDCIVQEVVDVLGINRDGVMSVLFWMVFNGDYHWHLFPIIWEFFYLYFLRGIPIFTVIGSCIFLLTVLLCLSSSHFVSNAMLLIS